MRAFRIADRRHPIFDGAGARRIGGRWNSPGRDVIYAAESFSLALLEVLVHANLGCPPKTHAVIEIGIPDGVSIETTETAGQIRWYSLEATRFLGDQWLAERRSCVLLVPSVVAAGRERNVLINPAHAECARLEVSAPEEIFWDARLFPVRE